MFFTFINESAELLHIHPEELCRIYGENYTKIRNHFRANDEIIIDEHEQMDILYDILVELEQYADELRGEPRTDYETDIYQYISGNPYPTIKPA